MKLFLTAETCALEPWIMDEFTLCERYLTRNVEQTPGKNGHSIDRNSPVAVDDLVWVPFHEIVLLSV